MRNSYLVIPGIGRIQVNTFQAKLETSNRISPQRHELDLRGNVHDGLEEQLFFLAQQWSCSMLEAKYLLQNFSQLILKHCVHQHQYYLPGIGYVKLVDEAIAFESNGVIEQRFDFNACAVELPGVQKVKAVEKTRVSEEIPAAVAAVQAPVALKSTPSTEQVPSGSRAKTRRWRPAVAVLASLLLIACCVFWFWQQSNKSVHPTVFYSTDSEHMKAVNQAPDKETLAMPEDLVLEDVQLELESKNQASNPVDQLDNNQDDASCVYVMGLFRNKQYLNRRKRAIEDAGFEVRIDRYYGANRIAAVIPCTDQEKLETLRHIEKDVFLLE